MATSGCCGSRQTPFCVTWCAYWSAPCSSAGAGGAIRNRSGRCSKVRRGAMPASRRRRMGSHWWLFGTEGLARGVLGSVWTPRARSVPVGRESEARGNQGVALMAMASFRLPDGDTPLPWLIFDTWALRLLGVFLLRLDDPGAQCPRRSRIGSARQPGRCPDGHGVVSSSRRGHSAPVAHVGGHPWRRFDGGHSAAVATIGGQ